MKAPQALFALSLASACTPQPHTSTRVIQEAVPAITGSIRKTQRIFGSKQKYEACRGRGLAGPKACFSDQERATIAEASATINDAVADIKQTTAEAGYHACVDVNWGTYPYADAQLEMAILQPGLIGFETTWSRAQLSSFVGDGVSVSESTSCSP